ncbi:MAG: Hsp20/alpha crystallin family protein [Candidatus Altiarchaeota archaeon]|nr:Hsp20/alpha crystallin family protein [Candidatus Altiarchaeota archaeon]
MDPFDDINAFEKMMKKMLESFFGRGTVDVFGPTQIRQKAVAPGVREPLTDVYETKDHVIITMELPGAKKENIHLDVSSNGIEISAKQETVTESKGISGTSFTHFKKFMSLPTEVDAKSVDAKYNNGILEIRIKKARPTKGRKVKVK